MRLGEPLAPCAHKVANILVVAVVPVFFTMVSQWVLKAVAVVGPMPNLAVAGGIGKETMCTSTVSGVPMRQGGRRPQGL